jgi:hypothetical protein
MKTILIKFPKHWRVEPIPPNIPPVGPGKAGTVWPGVFSYSGVLSELTKVQTFIAFDQNGSGEGNFRIWRNEPGVRTTNVRFGPREYANFTFFSNLAKTPAELWSAYATWIDAQLWTVGYLPASLRGSTREFDWWKQWVMRLTPPIMYQFGGLPIAEQQLHRISCIAAEQIWDRRKITELGTANGV